jgi:hypothetical protein
MIKPPSLQSEMSLIYSGDPALKLPEGDEERARVLKLARETGRWQDLTAEGQLPTIFEIRPMTGSAFDWWCGETRRRQLVEQESAALALRMTLRKVVNFGDYKVKHERVDDFWLATREIIDAIYAAAGKEGRAVVLELGASIIERAVDSPSPKS